MTNSWSIIKSILLQSSIDMPLEEINERWNAKHRFYHNFDNHLSKIVDSIYEGIHPIGNTSVEDYHTLVIAAVFHDIVYNPQKSNNEEESCKLLRQRFRHNDLSNPCIKTITDNEIPMVCDIIMATKTQNPKTDIEKLFLKYDNKVLKSEMPELLQYEKQIAKEFQFCGHDKYIKGRTEFLEKAYKIHQNDNLLQLSQIVKNTVPNIGIYAGSFDPFHVGHLNILEKAEKIFDKVVIARGKNDAKLANKTQSITEIKDKLVFREVVNYGGLLTDYLKTYSFPVTLIRGLRTGNDLIEENKLMFYLKTIKPDIQIVYLTCDKEFEYVSSTDIRNLKKYGNYADKFTI